MLELLQELGEYHEGDNELNDIAVRKTSQDRKLSYSILLKKSRFSTKH